MPIDRDMFFSKVRQKPFGGSLTQEQVDGMNAIIDCWEEMWEPKNSDLRFLANPMAQCFHETSQRMAAIEEYGKGGSATYAQKDPQTGQAYYGRGLIQLTWRANYAKADQKMGWTGDARCEWNAALQLTLDYAVPTMFRGMHEGWFRSSGSPTTPNTLSKYFSGTKNDIFNAREIINGDKNIVPSWSNGVSIGKLIEGYHNAFLAALTAAYVEEVEPGPEPEPEPDEEVVVRIIVPPGVRVIVEEA
jgi:putative chitinase